ncbi:InlB B-repeat-containing protein [Bifidobacterium callitrichidarum]|uniref:Uncharacterized protein n=1 Tax=Bifidobacterium callitrichidarum TaxID=2052941 RepID=A0A2U2N0A9_9BIFI|nr:InlB B-repeat-containing protein [Bifidobacterium callitrichidarum]PWG62636.1 hypothetical protein DF196_11805 [Bifidobacterium callitrichidarum]
MFSSGLNRVKYCTNDSNIYNYYSSSSTVEYRIIAKRIDQKTTRLWYQNTQLNWNIVFSSGNSVWNGNSIGGADEYGIKYIGLQDVKAEDKGSAGKILWVTGSSPIIQVTPMSVSSSDHQTDLSPMPILEANGGIFPDGESMETPSISPATGLTSWTSKNTPTRDGYVFSKWTLDKAGTQPFTPGSAVSNGLRLYAQWEKDSGAPVSVKLNCNSSSPIHCSVTATYADKTVKTRTFDPAANANLDWKDNPIQGIRLDDQGYLADQSCAIDRCRYVSLAAAPADTGNYQAQMPTTGAPEGVSSAGLIAIGLAFAGLAMGLGRRRN